MLSRLCLFIVLGTLLCSGITSLPLLQSVSDNRQRNVTRRGSQTFPSETYLRFIQSHLSSPPTFRRLSHWDSIDAVFVQQLIDCVESDARCAYCLGSLYFQGTIPAFHVSHTDTGKNVIRALALWYYAASRGNVDAQYQLGVMYSTYYNPPAFLSDPKDIWIKLRLNASQPLCPEGSCASGDDKIEAVVQRVLPSTEAHRLITTMRVLDVEAHVSNELQQEEHLADEFLKRFYNVTSAPQTSVKPAIDEKSVDEKKCAAPSNDVRDSLFGDSRLASCLVEDKQHINVSKDRRFPLYRRDSLAVLYYYLAAQQDHVGAQLALGYRHYNHLGVPERCHAAAAYYLRVAREVVELSSEGIPQATSNIRVSILGLSAGHGVERNRVLTASGELKSHYLDLQFHVAETGDPRTQTAVGKLHLFGLEDLPQDYDKAFYYFNLAAQSDYKDALAYLGYLYALGLGAPANLDVSFKLFAYAATAPQDVLAHNGLGYIYFKGTKTISVNYHKAFAHFNISASRGFPDAQYNLGAMYLSGVGVPQSFSKGFTWLTRALEQGHSGATYMMGVIHLNGIGTLRDCRLAAALFKRVASKHSWVAERLQKASILLKMRRKDEAAYVYWSLAETGHEISQSNLALLLDGGGVRPLTRDDADVSGPLDFVRRMMSHIPIAKQRFFKPSNLFSLDRYTSIGVNRAFAQRYWELAALQSSPQGYCSLGDYAYYGWGVTSSKEMARDLKRFKALTGVDFSDSDAPFTGLFDSEGASMEGWSAPRNVYALSYVQRLHPEYRLAFELYEKAAGASPSPSFWGNAYLAQAEFSLARLHQLGAGVPQDFQIARRRFKRVAELDASVSTLPGNLSILMLRLHSVLLYVKRKSFFGVLYEDRRLLSILVNAVLLSSLLLLRPLLKRNTL